MSHLGLMAVDLLFILRLLYSGSVLHNGTSWSSPIDWNPPDFFFFLFCAAMSELISALSRSPSSFIISSFEESIAFVLFLFMVELNLNKHSYTYVQYNARLAPRDRVALAHVIVLFWFDGKAAAVFRDAAIFPNYALMIWVMETMSSISRWNKYQSINESINLDSAVGDKFDVWLLRHRTQSLVLQVELHLRHNIDIKIYF